MWIFIFPLIHTQYYFPILSTMTHLYRQKLFLFYKCIIIVCKNIHMIHIQKNQQTNTVFVVFYNSGQKICSPYTYKHFMHKLWINHTLSPKLFTKLSTIVKNSTKMPILRVIHNIHIVFHNNEIICGLMFITFESMCITLFLFFFPI